MSKCLPFFRRRNKKASRSLLCGAHDNPMSPGEKARLRSPQSAFPNSEVIFTFEKRNVLTMKKRGIHPESAEKESDASSPKLLLPIVVALGGSECWTEYLRRKGTEDWSIFWMRVLHALCVRKTTLLLSLSFSKCHCCCYHNIGDSLH